ncbi:V-type proton ATPase 16 kDa proteolipid subunit [Cymbomonas tetramitiformis]|uniref:V-type proton ATPase proteolipid subunit n=1 Tax=Cymbomonas tetramitiformis TaxID=36881 RepID=A0AAE0G3V7_9CHLO|nr:V-type proton ATPase 16 kDa proteolipid subunit [Cymbomonas tetramitiformis]
MYKQITYIAVAAMLASTVAAEDETAPFFGFMGAAIALVFSCMGAAYGTAKSGVGVASMGVMRPDLVMKSIVPVIMAGVLGIYGLVIAVIISTGIPDTGYCMFGGYAHLASGLSCGLSGLAAGMAIGIVGDAGVRANAQQPRLYVVAARHPQRQLHKRGSSQLDYPVVRNRTWEELDQVSLATRRIPCRNP